MKLQGTLHTALRALLRNPMRALLTTLGIVIGIGAVIAMMEIGQGSSAAIQKSITSMGANNLLVLPGTASSGGVSFGAGSTMTLTPGDYEAIVGDCPAVRCGAPMVRSRTQLVYSGRNWVPQSVQGSTPSLLDVQLWEVVDGDCFTDRDVLNANRVCLVGQTIARELFQGENPVGKELRIKNVAFKVIGVLGSKGANMVGMDQDDIVIAPWTSIKFRVSGSALANTNQSAGAVSSTVNTLNQVYPGSQVALFPEKSETQVADSMLTVRFVNVDHILVSAVSP
ncbi:MAG: ABC transporter permease, partial [Victivallaceae bacterium]